MPLKLRASLEQLSHIRDFVVDSATALGVAPALFDDLRLAVDEAVTNIIIHGYGGPGDIELELGTDGMDLVVRLRDQAPGFDPALAPAADLRPPGERDSPGGFGVYLMKSVMDEIHHQTTETGNELTMIKHGAVAKAAPPDAKQSP
jgi:serine/threonine-protein kinase RsbW